MKIKLAAAAIAMLAVAQSASALADGPRASSYNSIPVPAEKHAVAAQSAAPHYEWQYHYVGHHPRYEAHWVLVQ